MFKNYSKKKQYCFRKWLNKKYAVFNSLGKLIKIGSLSMAYALLVLPVKAKGESDSVMVFLPNFDIDEVSIAGSRSPLLDEEIAKVINIVPAAELASSPAGSINDQLDQLPGVDMRTRGPLGVQSDISIRGGNFEQATILLNGIKLTEAQTGHNSLNLPLNLQTVNRIELIKGPSSRIFGASAFSGALNIVALPDHNDYVLGNVAFGQHGYNQLAATLNKVIGKSRHLFSASRNSSSGYIDNTDFSILNLFYSSVTKTKIGDITLQGGYQNKAAGAQNFYTTAFPSQFEQMKTKFASIVLDANAGAIKIKPKAYVKRSHDRFELYRAGDDYYTFTDSISRWINYNSGDTAFSFYQSPNYHMTTTYGIETDFSYITVLGTTNIGFEYRNERINSNTMGNPVDTMTAPGEDDGFFDKERSRYSSGLYLEHAYSNKKITINAGLLIQYYSGFSEQFYPGIDVKYHLGSGFDLFANINKATRIPSFTELYYTSSTHRSDPDLKPENVVSAETGLNFKRNALSGYISFFYSDGSNLIDWVQDTNNLDLSSTGVPLWHSRNITSTITMGSEIYVKLDVNRLLQKEFIIKNISLGYSYLNKDISTGEYISAYTLDYLRHKINTALYTNYRKFYFSCMLSMFDRNDYYNWLTRSKVDFEPYMLLDAKIAYRTAKMEIFVDANNLTNKLYYDYTGIEMPGRWIRAGISRKLNF